MRKRTRQKGTVGSTFDDFLKGEGIFEEVQAEVCLRAIGPRIGCNAATVAPNSASGSLAAPKSPPQD